MTEVEDFSFSPCIQTASGAHPASSCTVGARGYKDKKSVVGIPPLPPSASMVCSGITSLSQQRKSESDRKKRIQS
jgi:hypothetical protein